MFFSLYWHFCSDRRAEEMAIPNMMTIVHTYILGWVSSCAFCRFKLRNSKNKKFLNIFVCLPPSFLGLQIDTKFIKSWITPSGCILCVSNVLPTNIKVGVLYLKNVISRSSKVTWWRHQCIYSFKWHINYKIVNNFLKMHPM